MRIAIASGKGGTGKTTVATNLVRVASLLGERAAYVDCDVEEPNGHIFLPPKATVESPIEKRIPRVLAERCVQCGECGAICQYGAIASFRGAPAMVFSDLCHACGGCALVCPSEAIEEASQPIGKLRVGDVDGIGFVDGTLQIGQHMGPPAIRAVKRAIPYADLQVIDAPPGTSCSAVEAVRGSEWVVLVTEPTPFGLHDLTLAVEMLRKLELPMGVVVNRATLGRDSVAGYCDKARIPVLGELPDDRAVAEAYSRGQVAVDVVPGYRERIEALYQQLRRVVRAA